MIRSPLLKVCRISTPETLATTNPKNVLRAMMLNNYMQLTDILSGMPLPVPQTDLLSSRDKHKEHMTDNQPKHLTTRDPDPN